MVRFWWETHEQNVPQLRRVPQTPRSKSDGCGTKRHLMLGRQGCSVLGPNLEKHLNTSSGMTRHSGTHQLKLDVGWDRCWP